jgi:hypothetical protein
MAITDMIISAVMKKGILYEARNIDADIDVPISGENQQEKIKIHIKCEHMTLRIEREGS